MSIKILWDGEWIDPIDALKKERRKKRKPKKWPILVAFILGVLCTIALAQAPMPPSMTSPPFWAWPGLYRTAEHLVVKEGMTEAGQPNGKIYFRIGWGECLAVYANEWQDMITAAPQDTYMNLRDYAVANLNPEGDAWGAEDDYNCPDDPDDGRTPEEYAFP